jgi:hypothetical protein
MSSENAAVHEQLNSTALQFSIRHEPARSWYGRTGRRHLRQRLAQTRQLLDRAQVQWTAAVSDAEALLHERQEGGE